MACAECDSTSSGSRTAEFDRRHTRGAAQAWSMVHVNVHTRVGDETRPGSRVGYRDSSIEADCPFG
jgi:hypothetical protein